MFLDLLRGSEKNRALVAQINVRAGFVLQFMHELGIHPRAGSGQSLKCRRSLKREVGEHAAGRVRCLASGLAAVHNQHGGAALTQRDRKREPDDSSANNDRVPGLHADIVEDKQHGIGASFIITQLSTK